MNKGEELLNHLTKEANGAWKTFHEEISTDENKDYRRGFRAGILCALLQVRVEAMEKLKNVD